MTEERRIVTILFGDVVGSTSLGESMDAEDLRVLLGRFYAIATEVVEEHGGTLEKFIGDAAMAIFGLRQAHDDDAGRALESAIDLRERLRRDPALGERLPIRIGVNTGEVVASVDPARVDFIVTGDAVNVAARLQQLAEPWQILASARTVSADRGAHEFGPRLELGVKGKAAPVAARSVVGRATAMHRPARLVGRHDDLAQLDLVARRAFGERRPYMVSLIAPAGTGKTRLVEEFLDRLARERPEVGVAVAQCLPYGQRLTYWPMRALLFDVIGLRVDSPPEATRAAIRAWLVAAGADGAEAKAELLAATIGASDADVQDRGLLFSAWRETLELAAVRAPLVLLVEDLHWSSDSLLDLIEYVLQPRGDSPLLMLALSRPELLERRPAWGGGRRNHVSLALEPLDDGAIGQLVGSLLEGAPSELVLRVARRAEGNPFFAGEIVRSLLEQGIDLGDEAAVAVAAGRLPDTVQATVLARIDSLGSEARRALQLGSVFGRSFTTDGIRSLGAASQPDAAIELLIERELLRETGRDELTFRHIIIRDVAYGTLTRAERAALHAAAGRWLEGRASDREDELAELVAFHLREAATLAASLGTPDRDLEATALRWLRRAADVAAGAGALAEAAAHLRAAIDLAPASEQPWIYQRLGDVFASGDVAMDAYERAWRLGAAQGLPPDFLLESLGRQLMVACRWYASVAQLPGEDEIETLIAQGEAWLPEAGPHARATFLIAQGFMPFWLRQATRRAITDHDVERAQARADEGLALAEAIDDASLISAALDAVSGIRQASDWRVAVELTRRRLKLEDRLSIEERLDALQVLAWAASLLGELRDGREAADRAMALVQPGGQATPFALAAPSWSAYIGALVGDWPATVDAITNLRSTWLEFERPAAAYALQGVLSGIDWARNRGEEQLMDRWMAVAEEIVSRFGPDHPVASVAAILRLDLDGIAEMVLRHERFPDRAHYVEHALALLADRRHAVPGPVLDAVLLRAAATQARVLHAQALRLRGLITSNDEDLAEALGAFDAMGAHRYAARVRRELGHVHRDGELLETGRRQLAALGELEGLPGPTGPPGVD